MNKPHFALWILVLLFSVFSLASCPASADPTVAWFPYANCHDWTFPTHPNMNGMVCCCPPWGGPETTHYLKRPLSMYPGVSNPIWSMNNVFYKQTEPRESWYDVADSEYTWVMALHNPGSSAITLRIEVFQGTQGEKANESTNWSIPPNTTVPPISLIKQTGNTNLVWDSVNDRFEISVPAQATRNVACYGTADSLYTTPGSSYSFHASIKITQENGADFLATIRGQNVGRWRTSPGMQYSNFGNSWLPRAAQFNFSYNAVYLSEYIPYAGQSPTNVLTLPWYRETYNPDDGVSEWSTHVSLVNARSSSDLIYIEVYDRDDVLLGSELLYPPANGRFTFLPSQYISNTTSQAGVVKIYGTYPVAVAMQMRFPKSTSTVSGQKTRIPNTQTAEFFIN